MYKSRVISNGAAAMTDASSSTLHEEVKACLML